MSDITLFDHPTVWQNMLPLTFVRSVADIRVGILTIREKYEQLYNLETSTDYCVDYLKTDFTKDGYHIASHIIPNEAIMQALFLLEPNSILLYNNHEIASYDKAENPKEVVFENELLMIQYPWDIFKLNDIAIRRDFELQTKGKQSQPIDKSNTILGNNVFLEDGAKVSCSILNSETGPIYIGANAEIMEGSMIRGPFALGEGATIKMGAKIYGATTVGPYSKVGGEVNNSVIFAYSNKGHDGFIGNSVIAEWCNLGADTNSSNLKNNYSEVKIYNYLEEEFISTHQQFLGLIMGDYSKSAINTMFNTGTVVGVCANIFGGGFPSKHIPSFSWYSITKNEMYDIDKAIDTIKIVMERREKKLSAKQETILRALYKTIEMPNIRMM